MLMDILIGIGIIITALLCVAVLTLIAQVCTVRKPCYSKEIGEILRDPDGRKQLSKMIRSNRDWGRNTT